MQYYCFKAQKQHCKDGRNLFCEILMDGNRQKNGIPDKKTLPRNFFAMSFTDNKPAQRSATLLWLGGLRASVTRIAQLAGDSSPGRATQARKVEG